MGFAQPASHLVAGELLPHHFTLTLRPLRRYADWSQGGMFLWHFPKVTPPGYYPAPCPVEFGLSSGHLARDHPVYLARFLLL